MSRRGHFGDIIYYYSKIRNGFRAAISEIIIIIIRVPSAPESRDGRRVRVRRCLPRFRRASSGMST